MAGNRQTKLIGVEKLSGSFKRLTHSVQQKIAPRMVAVAANSIKSEARKVATQKNIRRTGALINNIVIKREHDVPADMIQYNVGVRHGPQSGHASKVIKSRKDGGVKTVYVDDPYYWFWVEFGHRNVKRRIRSRGDVSTLKQRRALSTGFVSAKPFLFPAYQNKKAVLPQIMQNILNEEVEKFK